MQFAHLKGNYGIWFEVMPAQPGLAALLTPWAGGREHKQTMTRLGHVAAQIVLARDTGEGHIALDPHGDPIIHYWPNETDQKHLLRGVNELTRIALAGGAVGVGTLHAAPLLLESEGHKPGAVTDKALKQFLGTVERRGVVPNRLLLGTAHQMGTCRMGASPKTAVTDPYGAVYGVRGLYVADGSLMPTAAGVNPMLSIYALSYRVAQYIKSRA
jgi:choline dehydrogenase-like flavoprotein